MVPFFLPIAPEQVFAGSLILSGLAFFVIGVTRGIFTQLSPIKAGIETLFVGGGAAILAYYIGDFLHGYITGV